MELNREQIIKDLECCKFGKDEAKCKECNWHPWIKPRCWRLLASNALSLIKELTEENEAWQKQLITTEEKSDKTYYELACEVENLRKENENLHASRTELARVQEENERLKLDVEVCGAELSRYTENIVQMAKQHRADTVRKMQERLKSCFEDNTKYDGFRIAIWIDQIAKELLEDINETPL